MGQDTGLNNCNCEEHLLKPVASQLAADRLRADYQQATGQLPTSYGRVIDSWSVFGQNLPAICRTTVGPQGLTGN